MYNSGHKRGQRYGENQKTKNDPDRFGRADAGVYLEMSADPVNPASDDKPGPGETENPGKTGNPGKTDPPKTGDAMVMVPIAAACVILSILLLKKRQEA